MKDCPNCKLETNEDVCPECGHVLSEVDDTMDQMIAAASIPNLASLFKQGKKRGLIQPVHDYGHTA